MRNKNNKKNVNFYQIIILKIFQDKEIAILINKKEILITIIVIMKKKKVIEIEEVEVEVEVQ